MEKNKVVLAPLRREKDIRAQLVKEYKILKADYKAMYLMYSILRDLFVSLLKPIESEIKMLGLLNTMYNICKNESEKEKKDTEPEKEKKDDQP